jgi:hypothetical protein
MKQMKPAFPDLLAEKIHLDNLIIALYDGPAQTPFAQVIGPHPDRRTCLFAFYEDWMQGKTLKLKKENFGCRGCGHWLFNVHACDRQNFIEFLVDDEGLKAKHDLMNQWLEVSRTYKPENDAVFIGPYNEDHYDFIKSITFFVNPDQLSVLLLAANYFTAPCDLVPVKAPFGSGCSELLPLFDSMMVPQAIVGATDMAMREHLPANIMAFTVNKPMFENFCRIGENSFLTKPFLNRLKKARGGNI